jgi:hypothetical protein
MPSLQGFFVAWEADALPTELLPLNDLRLLTSFECPPGRPSRDAVRLLQNSPQPVTMETDCRSVKPSLTPDRPSTSGDA